MLGLYQILASVAVSLAIGFGGGWTTNGWRLGAEMSQLQAQQAINLSNGLKTALDQTTKFQKAKDEAVKKYETRTKAAVAGAKRADDESVRLRMQLADADKRLATAPVDALRKYANTANTVFAECGDALKEMAGNAQRNLDSAVTLQDAWPK